MKIRYFADFCNSLQCKEKVEYICGGNHEFEIVSDENYTHAIILNTVMPNLEIPKQNVIGFAFEPPHFLNITQTFIEYAKKHINIYYIGDKGNLPTPFQSGFAYMWHILPMSRPVRQKTKICSIMVSEKKITWGHKYRHQLVEYILSTNLQIDIYGRGCEFYKKKYKKDNRLRGGFDEMDSVMYSDYMFHIAIENFAHPDYLSEKILNPLLCGTTPIYWGSPNVDNYFPESSYTLTGNMGKDMYAIKNILKDPHKFVKQIDIDIIEEKTNILKNMEKIFMGEN